MFILGQGHSIGHAIRVVEISSDIVFRTRLDSQINYEQSFVGRPTKILNLNYSILKKFRLLLPPASESDFLLCSNRRCRALKIFLHLFQGSKLFLRQTKKSSGEWRLRKVRVGGLRVTVQEVDEDV